MKRKGKRNLFLAVGKWWKYDYSFYVTIIKFNLWNGTVGIVTWTVYTQIQKWLKFDDFLTEKINR